MCQNFNIDDISDSADNVYRSSHTMEAACTVIHARIQSEADRAGEPCNEDTINRRKQISVIGCIGSCQLESLRDC